MIIKQLRKNAGMTLQELADKLGTSNQTVSNWENEKTEPDIKSLIKLSALFGCSIDYIITGKVFDEEFVLLRRTDYDQLMSELTKINDILKDK